MFNVAQAGTGTSTGGSGNTAGACPASLSSSAQTVAGSGGSGNVPLSASASCSWVVASSASWLTISPAAGSGPATVGLQGGGEYGQKESERRHPGRKVDTHVHTAGRRLDFGAAATSAHDTADGAAVNSTAAQDTAATATATAAATTAPSTGGSGGSQLPGSTLTKWLTLGNAGVAVADLKVLSTGEICVTARTAGVRCSTNGGKTWVDESGGLNGADALFITDTPYGLLLVACQTGGGCATNGPGAGVYHRVGTAWQKTSITAKALGVVVRPDNSVFTVALDMASGQYAAYRSTNGQSFTKISTGVIFTGIGQRIGQAPNGDLWLGTEGNGVFRSTDGGLHWTVMAPFGNISALGFYGGSVFVALRDQIQRYDPATQAWTKSGNPIMPDYLDTTMSFTTMSTGLYATTKHTKHGVYRFDGLLWTPFLDVAPMTKAGVSVMGSSTTPQGELVVGMSDGAVLKAVP